MLKPRLAWLLVFVPVAVVLELTHADPVIILGVSALAILPLAGQIGHATEEMAARSGPQIGGLLNATFGNVTGALQALRGPHHRAPRRQCRRALVGGPAGGQGQMDVSVEIAVSSSTQIALFVAPVLLFVSLLVRQPMDLIFSGIEIAAAAFSAAILGFSTLDARSNWIEGAQLVAAYLIMAVSFFFL